MSINIGDIDAAISKITKELDSSILEATTKLALTIYQVLTYATPVDTGRARTNWIFSIGKPSSEVITANLDKTGIIGLTKAQATMQSNYKTGYTIHISNNLPYISRLNEGSSKQAPAGFVEKAIDTARRSFV